MRPSVTPDNSPSSDPNNRVVRIEDAAANRRARSAHDDTAPEPSPVSDLDKFARPEGKDDYRHRMVMNAFALGFLVLLVIAGIWIADTMAAMRKNQDCVLSGRRGCTPVDIPTPQRW